MFDLVILVTDKNRKSLNKNIKKINPKLKLTKDHIYLYLSMNTITFNSNKRKYMKDVESIDELLYPSYLELKDYFYLRETDSVFEFLNQKDNTSAHDKSLSFKWTLVSIKEACRDIYNSTEYLD